MQTESIYNQNIHIACTGACFFVGLRIYKPFEPDRDNACVREQLWIILQDNIVWEDYRKEVKWVVAFMLRGSFLFYL